MAKTSVISRAKVTKNETHASVKHKTKATASDDKILYSVSGNLTRTSNGTANLAYDAYKKKR